MVVSTSRPRMCCARLGIWTSSAILTSVTRVAPLSCMLARILVFIPCATASQWPPHGHQFVYAVRHYPAEYSKSITILVLIQRVCSIRLYTDHRFREVSPFRSPRQGENSAG